MWYVMQVRTGNEEETAVRCQAAIDGQILTRCFIPYYEEMRRYQGRWHKEKKVLFPGYVFLVSKDIENLYLALKQVTGLTKLLKTGEVIIALSEEEVAFLQRFGNEEQVVELSVGVIDNDRVTVLEGPLKGLEGCIRRINRHRRKAWVEIMMFGRMVEVEVGLEIVEKI